MNKKVFFVVSIVVLILVVMVVDRGDKGRFEEIVLSKLQEENFHEVSIEKHSSEDDIIKRSKEAEDINKLLQVLKEVEVKEIDRRDIADANYPEDDFCIRFENDNTYENIHIELLSEQYFFMVIGGIEVIEDKDNNVTKYEHADPVFYYYEIIASKFI